MPTSQVPRWVRWTLATIALLALALAPGCRVGESTPPEPGEDAALLRITVDHGATEIHRARVAPGRSVLRTLSDQTTVATAYGGGFVEAIAGREAGAQRDWFFFVDGVLSPVGARSARIAPGGDIWWDLRTWSRVRDPWATVAAWPAPFANREVAADPPLAEALRTAGATLVDRSSWRVRVGSAETIARVEPSWRGAMGEPERHGLTATIRKGRVRALGSDGRGWHDLPHARAIAVALPSEGDPAKGVLMVVAGRDSGAAERAAGAIAARPQLLAGHYARIFDGDGLPLERPTGER